MTLTSDTARPEASLPALPPLADARCPFGPVPEYAALRSQQPVSRVRCPTGITAWLVTRYEDVREVLGDAERFSSSPGQAAHVLAHMNPDRPPAEGEFTRLDGEEYQRFRRHIGAELSAPSALRRLLPQMQSAVDECIDALAASGPPADFYTRFAIPVTTAVVGGLIGVPAEDHELFLRAAAGMFGSATTEESIVTATRPLFGYVSELIAARRAEPGDDTVSRMIARSEQSARPLSDMELTMMVAGILISGFDTTATTMTHGLMSLFAHPEQLQLMRQEPARIPGAVEELVRSIGGSAGLTRRATRDTEIGGQPVRAGDFVVVAVQSANYDEAMWADAHRLDISRTTTGHLGFGYGPHQCIGMQVARQELTVAFTTLLRRVPTLRLAVEVEAVPFKTGTPVVGPAELVVEWEGVLGRDQG